MLMLSQAWDIVAHGLVKSRYYYISMSGRPLPLLLHTECVFPTTAASRLMCLELESKSALNYSISHTFKIQRYISCQHIMTW